MGKNFIGPIAYAYWWVGRLYQRPATALKARDNLTKAPLWGTIDETLEGVASVRAYELQSDLTKQFCQMLDENNRARYSWDAANRWLSCRLELVGAAVVGAASVCLAGEQAAVIFHGRR